MMFIIQQIEKLFKNVATIHGDVLTTESHLQLGVTHNKTQALIYYLSLKKSPQLTPQLKAIYEEEFRRAADQDEDRASFKIRPFSRGAY